MPGSPATSPNLAIPRFANSDDADFSGDVNSVVDAIDAAELATGAGENVRIIRGSVIADGTIVAGEGFAIARPFGTGNGEYRIDFDTAFDSVPAVVCCVRASPAHIGAYSETTTTCMVKTWNSSPAVADLPFSFVAIGPR